ncbi:MAG: RluA family pseudouridine synthase [Kiritimatiellaeota bacterium]|nr:RluA family pseudouridine synthase [Kiritimatiellota bacterium]
MTEKSDPLIVPPGGAGTRLDSWLAAQRPEHSRARWQQLIRAGCVRVNGTPRKISQELRASDAVDYTLPPPEPIGLIAQDIPLNILYEDADILVLNKPPDLVVHPAAGHASGTLVNALLHHCHDLAGIGGELRPGIVHRLDKDTSGALVVAKNEIALNGLVRQFKSGRVQKEYLALAWGRPEPARGTIATLIGRDPRHRKKMSAHPKSGRPARTDYEVLEQFADSAVLRLRIPTGRTHQIRVHLAHLGHPVIGDTVYGRARRNARPAPAARQMLHAQQLAFDHPRTGAPLVFMAPVPEDFRTLWRALRARDQESALPGAGGRVTSRAS